VEIVDEVLAFVSEMRHILGNFGYHAISLMFSIVIFPPEFVEFTLPIATQKLALPYGMRGFNFLLFSTWTVSLCNYIGGSNIFTQAIFDPPYAHFRF
jgi:hypothetical protein